MLWLQSKKDAEPASIAHFSPSEPEVTGGDSPLVDSDTLWRMSWDPSP